MTTQHAAALGFDESRAARDRASRFTAAGLSWPEQEEPESVHGRVTDYPFSVDVSNNRLLVAIDSSARLRRAVVADGIEDVRGHAIPGVYVHKQLSFWQGTLDLEVSVDGHLLDPSAVGLEFLDNVIPLFTQHGRGVAVERTVFSPADTPLRGELMVLLTVTNVTDGARSVKIRPDMIAGPSHALPELIPVVTFGRARGPVVDDALGIRLGAGEVAEVPVVITFLHEGAAKCPADPPIAVEALHEKLASTRSALIGALGAIEVPEDPWCGEVVTRASELARQANLVLEDGRLAGSFWGSNANPLPDVWTRDFGYSALGLLDSHPEMAARAIDFLARYGLPDAPWEREAEIHPDATGLQHSLGNACLAVVLADLFAQRHGRGALAASTTALEGHFPELADALLAERPGPEGLFRTLYISDGPSRGDFHTGSNILAWKAADALSTRFRHWLTSDKADALASLAEVLRAAITTHCVRVVEGCEIFVEGVYADGQFVRVHDGEESDLTLSSVYGLTDRDDYRIRGHAQWAQSVNDPYFARVTGGIDFWDWDDYNGVTYPGHIHMLSTAGNRAQLAAALRAIRQTTDVDGSFWWWPFGHGETEPDRVKRGLGKCGWCAGEFVSYMIHDVFGVRRDHDARTLTFAPYTPWRAFAWTGLAFVGGTVDLSQDGDSVTVVNRTPAPLAVTLQVPLRPGDMIEDITLNGENFRYQSDVVSVYDSAAVRGRTRLDPGATATLTVVVSQ